MGWESVATMFVIENLLSYTGVYFRAEGASRYTKICMCANIHQRVLCSTQHTNINTIVITAAPILQGLVMVIRSSSSPPRSICTKSSRVPSTCDPKAPRTL